MRMEESAARELRPQQVRLVVGAVEAGERYF
jgi:hypothetical protein